MHTERQTSNGVASDSSLLAGKTFVLIGAGGAGRALAFGAKSRGARVVIFNRNFGKDKLTMMFLALMFWHISNYEVISGKMKREQRHLLRLFQEKLSHMSFYLSTAQRMA